MRLSPLLLLVPLAVSATEAKWLQPMPSESSNWHAWKSISADDFFEVPASRLGAAESYLRDRPAVAQDLSSLAYFGRPSFACPAQGKIFLVRALYIQGGTGVFSLSWAGSALVVSHAGLGSAVTPQHSALVACLSSEPSTVYAAVSAAQ
jgi:hypothetical protein